MTLSSLGTPKFRLVRLTAAFLSFVSVSSCSSDRSTLLAPNRPTLFASYSAPVWHPSGKAIMFDHEPLVTAYWDTANGRYVQVFAESLSGLWIVKADGSGQHRIVSRFIDDPDWDAAGTTLAYGSSGTIFTASGSDTGLMMDTAREIGSGASSPSWSPDGSSIAGSWDSGIEILSLSGSARRTIGEPGWRQPDWSPHGDSLLFLVQKMDRTEIGVADSIGEGLRILWGQSESNAWYPKWSPDGSKIAFTGRANNSDLANRLWVMDSNGANAHRLTTEGILGFFSWSPDGNEIAYVRMNLGDTSLSNGTIWIVNVTSGAKRQLTFNTSLN
jgi:Tol biopolymer transport system component